MCSNFIPSRHHKNPTFKHDMNHPPSNNQYAYLGIPFNELLNLEPIIAKINNKNKLYG